MELIKKNKIYEIWWYSDLSEDWVCIHSNINTYEEAIDLINKRYHDSIDDKFRVYEKNITISNKLVKEI